MTSKINPLTNSNEDNEKQLTSLPQRAYKLTRELENNKLNEIVNVPIAVVFERFLSAKKENISPATYSYYRQQGEYFVAWCDRNEL